MPDYYEVVQFVNADEIVKGLSPFAPESVSFQAGKIMLKRMHELINEKENFGFETTLTTLSYKGFLNRAKQNGYTIRLLFLWLSSPAIAKQRVRKRVLEGGHSIPEDVITRRYYKGIKNLFSFLDISDEWLIINNSAGDYEWIAKKEKTKLKFLTLKYGKN